MRRAGPVEDGADQDGHSDGGDGVVDLGPGIGIRQRIDVGGVLGPHDEIGAWAGTGAHLGGEGERLLDVVVEHLASAGVELQAAVGNVALDEGDGQAGHVALGGQHS